MEERLERLRDRLIKEVEDIVNLKKEDAPSEIIEEKFIDFSLTKDAFIESLGCEKQPDTIQERNGLKTLVMGAITCIPKREGGQ